MRARAQTQRCAASWAIKLQRRPMGHHLGAASRLPQLPKVDAQPLLIAAATEEEQKEDEE